MIVACPKCRARYRVREEKLPPGGGNIQCPACSQIFPALDNAVSGPRPAAVSGGQPAATRMLSAQQSQQTIPRTENPFHTEPQGTSAVGRAQSAWLRTPSDPFGSSAGRARRGPPSPAGEDEVTTVLRPEQRSANRPSLGRASSGSAPAAPPAPAAKEQWKLRSPVGLVYDFPDLGALKTWLSSRDSVDGMSASRDGGVTWELLTAFPELRNALPKSARVGLARGEPAVEPKTTMLDAASLGLTEQPASAPEPPASRPSMSSAPAPKLPTSAPARHPSSSYAMTPPAGSPSRGDTLTPGPLPALSDSSPPVRESSGPKRPPARPSIRSGGHGATSGGSPAVGGPAPGSTGEQAAATTRRAPLVRPAGRSGLYRTTPRPRPRGPGLGTWLGLLITGAIIVAGVLQLSGIYDVAEALGLRDRSGPTEVEAAPRTDQNALGAVETADQSGVTTAGAPANVATELSNDPIRQNSQLLAQRRTGVNPHGARVTALTRQAREAANDGRIEDAINLVNNALQFDRANTDAICLLARLYRDAGQLSEADELDSQCGALRASDSAQVTEP